MFHNTTSTSRPGSGRSTDAISGSYMVRIQAAHTVPAGGLGCLLITIALAAIAAGVFFAFVM